MKENKTDGWNTSDIKKVLKTLKNNKARDPLGFVNELFKEDAAGTDAVNAIRLLMNRLKEETAVGVPLLSLANISTRTRDREWIWKMTAVSLISVCSGIFLKN